jgi:hypothetical protein
MVPETPRKLGVVARESSNPENDDLRLVETLLPHVQLVLSYNYITEICKIHPANLLFKVAEYNFALSHFTLAVQYCEEFLTLRKTIRGPEHEVTIQTMIEQANSLIMAGSREIMIELTSSFIKLSCFLKKTFRVSTPSV